MNKLTFDTGVVELRVNDAPLCFNPADPNLYSRFFALYNDLSTIEKKYSDAISKADTADTATNSAFEKAKPVIDAYTAVDKEIKERLKDTFGPENDFDAIFGGINVIAMTKSGTTAIENFMTAVMPFIEKNLKERQKAMQEKAKTAATVAASNRAQRRAPKK